jgi:hypothetical protein
VQELRKELRLNPNDSLALWKLGELNTSNRPS